MYFVPIDKHLNNTHMEKITEFKGQNGKIIVCDEYLAISRKTFGGFVSQGGASGERRYFYKDINSIEYKKPTFVANGYLKVLISGTEETNAKVGLLGSSSESMQDQNTVVLRAFNKKVGNEADRIYGLILQKIQEAKSSGPISNSTKLDELKKLGELKSSGVLTDAEFQAEKDKLLKG